MPTGIGVGIAGRVFKLTPGGGPVPVESWNCSAGACSDPGTGLGTYTTLAACQASCSATNPFIFTVNTSNTGTSASDQFQLPLILAGAISLDVDWGDGTSDTITAWNQAETLHTYAAGAGSYTIEITNTVRGWQFGGGGDCRKMTDISQWGEFEVTSGSTFRGCGNMTGTAIDYPTLTTSTLERTFDSCSLWNGVMDAWDVSSVTSMNKMFYYAAAFNQNINSWITSNVTDMSVMFYNAILFDQPLNTSGSSWDVSNVDTMTGMFSGALVFNQDISAWDVSSVTNLSQLFNNTTAFNQPLNSWDTSSVTDMSYTFYYATAFDHPLNSWDTSSVTTMTAMFSNATVFNQPLCSWDISGLTPSSTALTAFAINSALDRVNYNNILISWGITNLASTPGGLTPTFPSEYTNNTSVLAHGGYAYLQALPSPPWTITDGGGNVSAFDSTYSTHFDGIDDFLLAASTPLLGGGTGNFSISWWFKVDALTGANQRMLAFAQGGTGSQFFLGINTSNKLALTGPYTDTNSGFGVLSAGTWYNVIYRIDRSISTANVGWVVDGTNIDNKNETGIATFVGDGTTRFGKKGSTAQPFGGNMCDVAIWDKYLTDAECLEIYNSGSPNNLQTTSMSANLDYWWRLGENGGPCIFPTQTNVSGTTNVLTMTNMASTDIEKDTP